MSRHLKLLVDAGLLERHAEGSSAFFRPRLDGASRRLYDAVLDVLEPTDQIRLADMSRLEAIRAERAEAAEAYFEAVAPDWDRIRATQVADETVEQALLEAVGVGPIGTLLDVGTGTGRMLEVFRLRVERGIGVDLSREMLHLARTRLETGGLDNCSVLHGDVYALDLPSDSVDVAIVHHVLHFLDRPVAALAEVARVLRPGGLLLVVDFAPHQVENLRADYAHRRLGFAPSEVEGFFADTGLEPRETTHFSPSPLPDRDGDGSGVEALTVTLWLAHRSAGEPSAGAGLQVAS